MTRNLKALGLCLAAVFAMSAVAAAGAQAAEFHSAVEPTVLTGDEDATHKFAVGPAGVECGEVTIRGTALEKTEKTQTINADYHNCTFSGNPANVNMTGCDYLFSAEKSGEHAPVTVQCPEGKQIDIEIPSIGCDLYVGPQTTKAGTGVVYTNQGEGNKRDITVDITAQVSGTREKTAGASLLCSLIPANFTGTYTGSTTLTGYEDGGTGSTTDTDGNSFPVYTEGSRVGIWWE